MLAALVLFLFTVDAVANVMGQGGGNRPLEVATKALLIPLLAVWVLVKRGPGLVVAALLFSAVGDVLLEFAALFVPGMGAFALAHICYITFFLRRGAFAALKQRWYLIVAYSAAWGVLIAVLWPSLPILLRIPVAFYSILLIGTAMTAATKGWRTGLGGVVFVFSDALIAFKIAERPLPQHHDQVVMITYILAQLLLATGAVALKRTSNTV